MKKKYLLLVIAAAILALIAVWQISFKGENNELITVKPKFGYFKVTVTTTGELQAKSSKEIMGPTGARQLGIGQMKITRLIPEGTVVKAGDFVAELDKSEIMLKMKEIELSIQKYESQYLQAKLDSSLSLAASRDELENLRYSLEEKQLEKEQSLYEPPATIRRVEIDYERTKRQYEQSKKNYETKVKQAIAKLTIAGADVSKEKSQFDRLMQTFDEFTIKAPADGMVIYAKEWNGRRKVVGSTISFWDPVVATLPDLTSMESITFVNEVDIQKIKNGQHVTLRLDAMPNKKLTGNVTSVANIGEQRFGSDSKVFEVHVQVNEKDTTLLPSMTTSNEFLIEYSENVISIPLEAIHNSNKKSFVYIEDGSDIIRKQILVGMVNENEAVVKKGLTKEDLVIMNTPEKKNAIKTIWLSKK